MKILLLLSLVLFSGPYPTPRAIAKFCGNRVVHSKYKRVITQQMQSEGCLEFHFIPLEDDYILAYGVKVDIGE